MSSENNANVIINTRQHKCLIDIHLVWENLPDYDHPERAYKGPISPPRFHLLFQRIGWVCCDFSGSGSSFSCLLYIDVSHFLPLSLTILWFWVQMNYISSSPTQVFILVSFCLFLLSSCTKLLFAKHRKFFILSPWQSLMSLTFSN